MDAPLFFDFLYNRLYNIGIGENIMTNEELQRISFLAKKSRETGLTEEEKSEQQVLRRKYIDSVVGSLKVQLDNTTIVNPDGTSEKLSKRK